MKKTRFNIAIYLVLLLVISACRKDGIIVEPAPETKEPEFSEGMIQLGEKLENPYIVSNMRMAYNELTDSQRKSASISESEINTTHLYVRFLPKTAEEYAILLNDTNLQLFDYPLDCELKEGGTYYQDPEISDSSYTWKYCAVEKGYDFPNLEYEIIEELFLPESMEDETFLKNSDTWSFWDDLEVKALEITGNLNKGDILELKSKKGRKKWKPSGTIQMYDNTAEVMKFVPVRGVKVLAKSWFTTKSGLTNTEGEFTINHKFKGHVNYSIKWERNDYEIRHKRTGQAYYNGPRYKNKKWNCKIDTNQTYSRMYAIIHRAAHRYYYEYRKSLRTPPKRNNMLGRVTIGAFAWNESNIAYFQPAQRWKMFPEIRIFKPKLKGIEIYAHTIHELAHASHWKLGRKRDFNKADLIVLESWAMGVQLELTKLEYPSYSSDYENFHYARLRYTGIVEDMIDGNKSVYGIYYWDIEKGEFAGSIRTWRQYWDCVSGYTIKQLEDALIGQRTWNGWRDNIKDKYDNNTEDNLDAAFNYWNTER